MVPTAVGVTPAAAVSTACGVDGTPAVTALQSPNFYIDRDRDQLLAQYAGYAIDAGASERAGYWIELADFTGGAVSLGTGEAAAHRIPTVAAGETSTQYFLLKASGLTEIAIRSIHAITASPDERIRWSRICSRSPV